LIFVRTFCKNVQPKKAKFCFFFQLKARKGVFGLFFFAASEIFATFAAVNPNFSHKYKRFN